MEVKKQDGCYRHCQRFGASAVIVAAMVKRLIDEGYTGSFTVHFTKGEVRRLDQNASYSIDDVKKIAEVA